METVEKAKKPLTIDQVYWEKRRAAKKAKKLGKEKVIESEEPEEDKENKPKIDMGNRMMCVGVVTKTTKEYAFIVELIKSFRSMLEKLSAENLLVIRATATVGAAKLIPYFAAKKGCAAALYDCNVGAKKDYELRTRFFEVWEEFRANSKHGLPKLHPGVYDACTKGFSAAMAKDMWKRIDGCDFQRFRGFGIGNVESETRRGKNVKIHAQKRDIIISLRLFATENEEDGWVHLVARGPFEKKKAMEFKELDDGTAARLCRFANGSLPFSTPILRLDKKGRLKLDISYKKGPFSRKTDGVKGRVLEVTMRPSYFSKKNDDGTIHTTMLSCEAHVLENGVVAPKDKFSWKGIRCADVVAYLAQFESEKNRLSCQKDAAKSNRDRTSIRYIQERSDRMTLRRSRFTNDKCHVWAKEIVGQAKRFNTDGLVLRYPATLKKVKDKMVAEPVTVSLHGYSWPWDAFKRSLDYHAKDAGFEVVFEPMIVDAEKQLVAAITKEVDE